MEILKHKLSSRRKRHLESWLIKCGPLRSDKHNDFHHFYKLSQSCEDLFVQIYYVVFIMITDWQICPKQTCFPLTVLLEVWPLLMFSIESKEGHKTGDFKTVGKLDGCQRKYRGRRGVPAWKRLSYHLPSNIALAQAGILRIPDTSNRVYAPVHKCFPVPGPLLVSHLPVSFRSK